MAISDNERRIRLRLRDDFPYYAARALKIRTKAGDVRPFELNRAQQYIHERLEGQRAKIGKVRALVLKGRQQGVSTYVSGRYYWRVTHRRGARVFILTHEAEATSNLFEMAKRYNENCPEIIRPSTGGDSARELTFDRLDSGYKVGTAGNKAVGRSSTVQYLHGSEVAFWPHADEHAKGLLQAVPDAAETEVILESTANGTGNYFHQQWLLAEAGLSEFQSVFVPWFWQPEYRKAIAEDFKMDDDETELARLYELDNEQIAWRRAKIVELSANGSDGVLSFRQEYPCTAQEAFISTGDEYALIQSGIVAEARNNTTAEPYGALVVGVDPARFGDDRTAIIRRQGRVAFGLESHEKIDTMRTVGLVVRIIKNESPRRVFIDVGGLGAGIVDRLRELGYGERITAVNSAERALDADRYYNRRAEMWGEMKLWLADKPAKLPDSESLQTDLCSLRYKLDLKGRLQLEAKEEAKRRGARSPDEADALALTFAAAVPLQEEVFEPDAVALETY